MGLGWSKCPVTLSSPSFCLLLPQGAEERYIGLLELEEREWTARPRDERAGWTCLVVTAVGQVLPGCLAGPFIWNIRKCLCQQCGDKQISLNKERLGEIFISVRCLSKSNRKCRKISWSVWGAVWNIEPSCASSASLLALAVRAFPVSSCPPAFGSHLQQLVSPSSAGSACDSNVPARWGELLHITLSVHPWPKPCLLLGLGVLPCALPGVVKAAPGRQRVSLSCCVSGTAPL